MQEHPHLPTSGKKCKVTFSQIFIILKEKMNCGGNDGNGGRDKDGKTPEQRHRENVQKMDYWKRREEV